MTKGGIQGRYDPTGRYFAIATNNVGTTDGIITVVQAFLPTRVPFVNKTEVTPQSVTLFAIPPTEDNCISTIAFEILYHKHQTNNEKQPILFPVGKFKYRYHTLLSSNPSESLTLWFSCLFLMWVCPSLFKNLNYSLSVGSYWIRTTQTGD